MYVVVCPGVRDDAVLSGVLCGCLGCVVFTRFEFGWFGLLTCFWV